MWVLCAGRGVGSLPLSCASGNVGVNLKGENNIQSQAAEKKTTESKEKKEKKKKKKKRREKKRKEESFLTLVVCQVTAHGGDGRPAQR